MLVATSPAAWRGASPASLLHAVSTSTSHKEAGMAIRARHACACRFGNGRQDCMASLCSGATCMPALSSHMALATLPRIRTYLLCRCKSCVPHANRIGLFRPSLVNHPSPDHCHCIALEYYWETEAEVADALLLLQHITCCTTLPTQPLSWQQPPCCALQQKQGMHTCSPAAGAGLAP